MKQVKNMMLAFGLAGTFAMGGCGNDLDKAKGFVDELCACKDKACADKVSEKAKKALSDDVMKKLAKDSPKEFEKLMGRMMECAMKVEMGAAGGDAPAEDGE